MAGMTLSDIHGQLTRYGDDVMSEHVHEILEILTDINDDMCHGSHPRFIYDNIVKIRKLLVLVEREIYPQHLTNLEMQKDD